MQTHKYWAYGLKIESAMELPEMLPHQFTEEPDLRIELGPVPEDLTAPGSIREGDTSINATEFILRLPIGRYLATNGNKITVDIFPNADDKSIRLFLLSNAMPAIIHQRHKICLHAGAIVVNNELVLICGDSGAGKSTTISALMQKGYQIFSDDVCVLNPPASPEKYIDAYPSYRVVKLWEDSLEKLDQLNEKSYENKLRPLVDKYLVKFEQELFPDPLPIKKLFILKKGDAVTTPSIQKLSQYQAFKSLLDNNYRPSLVEQLGLKNLTFEILSQLAGKIEVLEITRPVNGNSIEEVIGLIQKNLPLSA